MGQHIRTSWQFYLINLGQNLILLSVQSVLIKLKRQLVQTSALLPSSCKDALIMLIAYKVQQCNLLSCQHCSLLPAQTGAFPFLVPKIVSSNHNLFLGFRLRRGLCHEGLIQISYYFCLQPFLPPFWKVLFPGLTQVQEETVESRRSRTLFAFCWTYSILNSLINSS